MRDRERESKSSVLSSCGPEPGADMRGTWPVTSSRRHRSRAHTSHQLYFHHVDRCLYWYLRRRPVASIPIPGRRSLRPVKNRGKSCYDDLHFTKQTLVDKKINKNNNIELDSENCHVEQLIIETVISNREET